ncbi:MAG: lipid A biosynthesis [Alphaproteobacteria bacterium]|nr:lipid A biosynthesis [Alphaproteobacteria bacterium]
MAIIASMSSAIEQAAIAIAWVLITVFPFLPETLPEHPESLMIVVGFGGQFLFAMRFIIQWITSEGAKRSVIPVVFWYFSIGGGSVLLLYAIWRQDPVIIAGQGLGLFIYFRNLIFIHREKKDQTPS